MAETSSNRTQPGMPRDLWRWLALIGATLLISFAFLGVIQPFLIPLLLAAIASAMAMPLFKRISRGLGGRNGLASALTLILLLVGVFVPLLLLTYLAAVQATGLADAAVMLFDEVRADPSRLSLPRWLPFRAEIIELGPTLMAKVGELASAIAQLFVSSLSAMTRGTASFFLDLFIFLYGMFFFLQMDTPIILQVLRFTGLRPETQALLHERAMSISRATLKGTLLIGLAQGLLGGIGFWVTGIPGSAFWGVIMAVLSVIPGLGPTFVVFCGVIYLLIEGAIPQAIGLAIWGAAVVGTIDNVLRPILVGRDAKLHDILILISTLGGLATFGATGLVLGPVLAGLFVAIWTTVARSTDTSTFVNADMPSDAPTDSSADGDDPVHDVDMLDPELSEHVAELRARKAAQERDEDG